MTVDGFEQAVNELLSAQPFQIFTIELKGGRLYEIDFPDAVFLRQGVGVFTGPGGVKRAFDGDSVLQIVVATAEAATA